MSEGIPGLVRHHSPRPGPGRSRLRVSHNVVRFAPGLRSRSGSQVSLRVAGLIPGLRSGPGSPGLAVPWRRDPGIVANRMVSTGVSRPIPGLVPSRWFGLGSLVWSRTPGLALPRLRDRGIVANRVVSTGVWRRIPVLRLNPGCPAEFLPFAEPLPFAESPPPGRIPARTEFPVARPDSEVRVARRTAAHVGRMPPPGTAAAIRTDRDRDSPAVPMGCRWA